MLGPVAAVSAPGLVARVVALLQDELLALELGVLVAHPATSGPRVDGWLLRRNFAFARTTRPRVRLTIACNEHSVQLLFLSKGGTKQTFNSAAAEGAVI